MEDHEDHITQREVTKTLLEVELNPRTTTEEGLMERSVDIFSRNPVHNPSTEPEPPGQEEPVISDEIRARLRRELGIDGGSD